LHLLTTDLALEWMDPAGADRSRATARLLAIARELRPDIIHLNSFREGAIAWPAPVLVAAHSCVVSWWQACRHEFPQEPVWHAYADAARAGLQAADAWVAPTRAFRDAIQTIYQPVQPGIVIHNGIDLPSQRNRPKRELVLASGRMWDCAKNLQAVLAIAPQCAWPVEIAGPTTGPNGETAPSMCNVRYLGALRRDQLRSRMAESAIYLAPARYEPFGLGVLEAAAARCALVLSDIPTLRELWDGAALFVAPDDTVALATALDTLIRDDRLRAQLQQAAATRARSHSLADTVRRYGALYDTLLGRTASMQLQREARA
jgi:glycogen synthase